jgi:hypothetical protein
VHELTECSTDQGAQYRRYYGHYDFDSRIFKAQCNKAKVSAAPNDEAGDAVNSKGGES